MFSLLPFDSKIAIDEWNMCFFEFRHEFSILSNNTRAINRQTNVLIMVQCLSNLYREHDQFFFTQTSLSHRFSVPLSFSFDSSKFILLGRNEIARETLQTPPSSLLYLSLFLSVKSRCLWYIAARTREIIRTEISFSLYSLLWSSQKRKAREKERKSSRSGLGGHWAACPTTNHG